MRKHNYEGVTEEEFYKSAPRKRIAAGILARDQHRQILLVKPTYKEPWEIPGGVVDEGESPLAACRRELQEELGVSWPVGRLLVIDYAHSDPPFIEGLLFVFDGGIHHNTTVSINNSAMSELSDAEWCPVPIALARVEPRLSRRLASALDVLNRSTATKYLEEGVELR